MSEPRTFAMTIVTRAEELFDGEVLSVIAPGADGYFGIKADHAPFIVVLKVGEVAVTMPDQNERYFAVAGGVAEVRGNVMVVLADIGERAVDIDVSRAEQAAERARARLQGISVEERVDITQAEVALVRAINRLRVARRGH